MSELDLIFRLFLAAIFGALVGWERQVEHRPAGLRTHMLVSLGSALFTLVSFAALTGIDQLGSDPTRIAAGIVTGIGFLGAGAIIQSKERIIGLTTAASIWMVAAIGMAAGFGLVALAGTATVITLIILYTLEKLEDKLKINDQSKV